MTFSARSATRQAVCPGCGTVSGRVHGGYRRRLADVAVSGHRTVIDLLVNRFTCPARDCDRRTFVEQVDGLTERFARRTASLHRALEKIALALAGRPAGDCGAMGSPNRFQRPGHSSDRAAEQVGGGYRDVARRGDLSYLYIQTHQPAATPSEPSLYLQKCETRVSSYQYWARTLQASKPSSSELNGPSTRPQSDHVVAGAALVAPPTGEAPAAGARPTTTPPAVAASRSPVANRIRIPTALLLGLLSEPPWESERIKDLPLPSSLAQ
ncbi:transposase family protein [Micromonospora sp. KC606]|nr:transposase family protein [Micromonospora sp. KC606]